MNKFGRNYILSVQDPIGGNILIEPPFTMEFDITRNVLSSANVCSIRVYNLNENTRKNIYKDQFDFDLIKGIKLKAGYDKNVPVIFDGNIIQAWSVREGNNFITQIESFDGGFAYINGKTSESFPKESSQRSIIKSLMDSLPNVQSGVIGEYPGSLSRGNSYNGSTTEILRELSNSGFFIDNGKAHCLGNSECLQGELEVINSASGLLGTPVREETYLTFDIIFEPRLVIGQKIRLDSITGANFNGDYKIVSLKHKGIISESVCGNAVTTVGLFWGSKSLTVVT